MPVVVHRLAALASPEDLLELQNRRPCPDPLQQNPPLTEMCTLASKDTEMPAGKMAYLPRGTGRCSVGRRQPSVPECPPQLCLRHRLLLGNQRKYKAWTWPHEQVALEGTALC